MNSFKLIALVAVSLALAAPRAGAVEVSPAGESARVWTPPFQPMSMGAVTGLQAFMKTNLGTQIPSLAFVNTLDPNIEAHRRIAGALGFSPELQAKLQAGSRDAETVAYMMKGFGADEAAARVAGAVDARADEIAAAVANGRIDSAFLSVAAQELAPFSSSPKVKAVMEMAAAARETGTMSKAMDIAARLGSSSEASGMDASGSKEASSDGRLAKASSSLNAFKRETPAPAQTERMLDNVSAAAGFLSAFTIGGFVLHFTRNEMLAMAVAAPGTLVMMLVARSVIDSFRKGMWWLLPGLAAATTGFGFGAHQYGMSPLPALEKFVVGSASGVFAGSLAFAAAAAVLAGALIAGPWLKKRTLDDLVQVIFGIAAGAFLNYFLPSGMPLWQHLALGGVAGAAFIAALRGLVWLMNRGFKRSPKAPAPPALNESFVLRHGSAILAIPGVVSVQARSIEEGAGGYSWPVQIVQVEVSPYGDKAAIMAALEPYRFSGIDMRVMCKGWDVHQIDANGESGNIHMKPLDPRMELSLLGERNANELFAERHGAELHAVPGVISVKARTVEEGAGGYSWKVNIVEVEVAPYADSAAIDAAVERYRYAGVDLRVMSRGWPIFHVNTRGERNELHMKKLDPRMALSAAA